MSYIEFIDRKRKLGERKGFEPLWMPSFLFDFQQTLTAWAIEQGRAALFADCGLGKTAMLLVWAENVRRKTDKPVLILTPIAVGKQIVSEGEKFGIEAAVCRDGKHAGGLVVTNYERLHYFKPADFSGVVCDESSILKNAKGATRQAVTEFVRLIPYRLLDTATAAPNDFHELGTSSEALGEMGYRDMITMFFKQEVGKDRLGWARTKYRMKEHARKHFWRWVCSWSRSIRLPSDVGGDDSGFVLPPLEVQTHIVERRNLRPGFLFPIPARTNAEQLEERRATINERCEAVANMVSHDRPAVVWCHLNPEGNLLANLIPDSVQVSGADTDDDKESKLQAFTDGNVRCLITKPKIGAWGLNWQHCNHVATFISHSYEQYYQLVRRCWRFGQLNPVRVDVVSTEGEAATQANLDRKSAKADEMFSELVAEMNHALHISFGDRFDTQERIPSWL